MSRQRTKGTKGENEALGFIRNWWPRAERRALMGVNDSGDIAGAGPFAVSVKRQENWRIHEWMDELAKQKANAKTKVGWLMARRNRKGWIFFLDEETMTHLLNMASADPAFHDFAVTPSGQEVLG